MLQSGWAVRAVTSQHQPLVSMAEGLPMRQEEGSVLSGSEGSLASASILTLASSDSCMAVEVFLVVLNKRLLTDK